MIKALFAVLLLSTCMTFAEAVGANNALRKDFFDPELLKIDTSKYLGNYVSNTEVVLERGERVKLYELLKGKPTVLLFSYYTCEGSCPIRIDNLNRLIKRSDSLLNRDFRVLVLSFDEKDNLETLKKFKESHGPFTSQWVFGLIPKENIETLTNSVGFRFFFSERDKTFVHTNVYVFLAPDGRITRYLFGINPAERDVRIALAEAEGGRISTNSVVDLALLVCYTYDPSRSAFVVNPTIIFGGVGFAALGSVVMLAFISSKLVKREVQ
ncbi:protein SCO1/2 [Hydrogenivirga caldilitoris]|uniref:Protein SCO1/2 n=1 Tax=Hydrogenivirga caldilitoris TaxID=246264 RepID=A0A497XSQ3_9AQUI|nr:SCO family protein [Hydrogenivirga caldilitoris]RLJ71291.1 protein SCO1/2 [Hydrogenivirga caldilitoris]